MGNLEKALDNIDTEELIQKDELETQKEIAKIRNKTGINFTSFCSKIKKHGKRKRDKDDLVMLYEMWCGEMAVIKTKYWQKPEEWIVDFEKHISFGERG